jgi:glycosyltransferase involved in cell wall biosynthesis
MFEITLLKWYHWNTLACRSDRIYDLYRVYDKNWNLILETEDEIVELPKCNTEWIYVRAYNNNHFEKWESYSIVDLPPREHSRYYNLSVVVPLYNSELFMCRTIDSILSSSLEDIELILIDDWSTDKTREIAKRYEKEYWCVKAIHQTNKWVSVARNRWMDMASGEYLAFCDNDDIVHPFMYERLYQTCKECWTDIAICPALIRNDIENKELYLTCSARPERTVVYTFEEMVQNRWTTGNIFRVAVRNKIVKTEIAQLAQFPTWYTWPWILYEDVAYTSSLYSYIDKFALCKDAVYTRDKRKQKTVWTASTRHQKEDNEYVWKMFIYWFSYALYNKSWKHLEAHDYTHFKRLIEAYDKFNQPSPLRTHWDIKLKELITSQKLNENKLIMADKHLAEIVNRFI